MSEQQASSEFFKPISSRFTIRQKIDFAVFKYQHRYFLDQEPDEIDNLPDEVVRPLRKITKENLNSAVSRDQRAKSKKLAYAMNQVDLRDPKFAPFADALDKFTSVSAAEKLAAKLFSEHSVTYSSSQATVKSIDGERRVVRRQVQNETIAAAAATPDVNDNNSLIKHLDNPQVDQIRKIINMKPKESLAAVAEENDSLSYALSHVGQPDHHKLTNHQDRLVVLLLAQQHKWLKS